MIERLKKLFRWLLGTTAVTPQPLPSLFPAVVNAPPPLAPAIAADPTVERDPHDDLTMGVFYFREQILDRLEEYGYYLRRMKRADQAAYSLYSQIGAAILSDDAGYENNTQLSAWWTRNRPSFGAASFALLPEDGEHSESVYPRFMYFQKIRPYYVEPFNGDIYEVNFFYDKRGASARRAACFTYYVGLSPEDTKITLLKSLRMEEHVIKHKHKPGKSHFTRKNWKLPDFSFLTKLDDPTISRGAHLFVLVASAYENSMAGAIRVGCTKDGIEATFNVDMKRTAYFFKDRATGRDKRIFHVVRPHGRVYQSGKTADIKMHFRGLRKFEWNGYDVNITVPGKHHAHLMDFADEATALQPQEPRPAGFLSMRRMGLKIQQVLHA